MRLKQRDTIYIHNFHLAKRTHCMHGRLLNIAHPLLLLQRTEYVGAKSHSAPMQVLRFIDGPGLLRVLLLTADFPPGTRYAPYML